MKGNDVGWRYGKWSGPGQAPTRGHDDDAGFDLYVRLTEETMTHYDENGYCVEIKPGEYAKIPSGVSIQWPDGFWGFLVGRSSTFNRGLMVNPGIIDPGYRGDLFAVVRNISNESVMVKDGERVAQIIPLPMAAWAIRLDHVNQLDLSERGDNGFGSTGA